MPETHSLSALPMLSSPQNQRVKDYVELRTDGNVRRERNRFLLEGRRAVAAALSLPHVLVHELIFADHLLGDDLCLVEQARARDISLTRVSKDVFKKIADVMTPQGIAAVVGMPEWNADEVLGRRDALLVVACGIQDPGNVGTLIRSCEAAGAAGLVTLEGTADPFNAKVVRATAAGLLALPILRFKTDGFLTLAAQRSLRLVATAAQGGVPHRGFDWRTRPLALCIGSEGAGLPPAVAAACRETVTIPMKGKAESLNAAVAASILLFEAQAC
ncbi:MAG: RNA methyltransferase [Planctomycetota bacterium]|nr:RNA methyltransferase [Planctomycetota bacterium]